MPKFFTGLTDAQLRRSSFSRGEQPPGGRSSVGTSSPWHTEDTTPPRHSGGVVSPAARSYSEPQRSRALSREQTPPTRVSGEHTPPSRMSRDWELERPSTQMAQNRLRQLGNGAAPSWWGDQPAPPSPRMSARWSAGGRASNGGVGGGVERAEPFTPSHAPPTTWGTSASASPASIDRTAQRHGSASGASIKSAADETTAMLLELSRKLDETRLELRQTEDRLLESDSARQRDHDAHVREQEAAVQLLREAQEALEAERARRTDLEGELAKVKDSESRWRNKCKKLEADAEARGSSASNTPQARNTVKNGRENHGSRASPARNGSARPSARNVQNGHDGSDGSSARNGGGDRDVIERGDRHRDRGDSGGGGGGGGRSNGIDSSRRPTRPPQSREGHANGDGRIDRVRPRPPSDPPASRERTPPTRGGRGDRSGGGGRAERAERSDRTDLTAETVVWGVDDQVIASSADPDVYARAAAENASTGRTGPLVPCPHCNRSFLEDRVARHAKTCKKLQQPSKRKPIDPTVLRTRGTEAEQFAREAARRAARERNEGVKQTGWREKSEAFRAAMRAGRM